MFYTPRGLKIRLEPEFIANHLDVSFDTYAYHLEFFEMCKSVFSMIAIYILLFVVPNSLNGMIISGTIVLIIYLYSALKLFFEPDIFSSATMLVFSPVFEIYLIISKFYLPYVILLILTIVTKNYFAVLGFLGAKLLGFLIVLVINSIFTKIMNRKYGLIITDIEYFALKQLKVFGKQQRSISEYLRLYQSFVKDENLHL